MSTPPLRSCPDDEVLQELAAGIGSPELAEQTMQHASRCPACGPTLRRYLQEFAAEESPENTQILKQLKSSDTAWQRRLVRDVVLKRRNPWLKFAPVFAAAVIAIVAVIEGPSLVANYKIRKAQEQAAAAFADRRTTAMRLPSASYAPYQPFPTILGAENGRSLDELPPALHDASSAANENLKSAHPDPRWLQVQGRALLWEATPASLEKAEKDFEKARAEGLNSPSLEIDLAAAYFERDNKSDHPNLQRTLNLLNKVLTESKLSDQDRASALYNLAIAYERTQAWDLAVSTWEQYLKLDPSSGWAEEAKRHLEGAKEKLGGNKQQGEATPGFFLQQLAQHRLNAEDPEKYQLNAITQWLPVAIEKKDSESARAVNSLSALFEVHHDFWWRDFLKALNSADSAGVQALSDAVRENDEGRYAAAEKDSIEAAKRFVQYGNKPGELRARFEEVYAHRRKLKGTDCIAHADPLWRQLGDLEYPWLKSRLALEKAECRNLRGEFSESDSSLSLSRAIATDHNFPVLVLQDIGISAGMKHLRGDCDESWKEANRGLELYWATMHIRGERLFQFYAVMLLCSLETGSLDLAEPLIRHAIALREDPSAEISQDPTIDGLLHLHLANILRARKKLALAADERNKAMQFLSKSKDPTKEAYKLITDIEPAEFQLQQGDAEQALATLEPLEKALQPSQDKFFALHFKKTLGDTYLRLGRFEQAKTSYDSAIATAEASLDNITDTAERLAWLRATDESYRGLVRVLLKQNKDEEALQLWEWYQSRSMLQAKSLGKSTSAVNLQEISQKQVAPTEETRVVYAEFKDGLQIWVSRNSRLRGKWVDLNQQDFETAAREFASACANEGSSLSDLQQQGMNIYSMLIEPISTDLADASVVSVELDRRIYNLPIEALRSPAGWYFGEKYAVVYSPGRNIEDKLNFPRQITGREFLFLVDATHSSESGYLPGMEEERKLISELFPHARAVDSDKESWARVRTALGNSEVFHYMGHGRPLGTGIGLAFNHNQPLQAKDFSPELFKHSQLVVLSACSTARAKNGLLDTDNLVHALLAAGVPRVVASKWNVDSESTSQLMKSFYVSLMKGKSVPLALLEARHQMLMKASHPYYWAGFSVAGKPI